MAERKKCCSPESGGGEQGSCFRVQSIVTVDERGQIVLPKEVRTRIGLAAGDKLTLISWEQEGRVCCLSLIPVDELADLVKGKLQPLMRGLL